MPKATVAFLDVGQGDSTVVLLPDRVTAIVIDCPSSCITSAYLHRKGVYRLDHVFVTHTDLDHASGIADLLTNFTPTSSTLVYNPDTWKVHRQNSRRRLLLRKLAKLVDRDGLSICNPRVGHHWNVQGLLVESLHPSAQDLARVIAEGDVNNASIVLKITFSKYCVLLAGDVEARGWQWILERNTDLKADVFKFPHYGAWYAPQGKQPSLEEVLRRINPALTVISVGTHNRYDHPSYTTMETLRSYPQLRCACTEATRKCHPSIDSGQHKEACPCAGTIEVIIRNSRIEVLPDQPTHLGSVESFDSPQCK